MIETVKRDRPAKNPGGMDCQECGEIFIGEEWHYRCAICEAKHEKERRDDEYTAEHGHR